jgi:selenide,water dikinase
LEGLQPNALSDVYAMGGKPLMATILGWPIDKLAPEVAAQVMEGVERPR